MEAFGNRDAQPEQDIRPSRLASLSMGLVVGSALLLGGLIGALIGHFLLEDAFGLGHDVTVGAVSGAIIAVALGILSVRAVSSHVAERHGRQT